MEPIIFQTSIIIDGAYLMIGILREHNEILTFVNSKSGVDEFLTAISYGISNEILNTPLSELPIILQTKLKAKNTNTKIQLAYQRRNFICAYSSRNNKRYYPEKVIPEAWQDFNFYENLHTYKQKSIKCNGCNREFITKVQSGVDIGIASKLFEEVIISDKKMQSDLIILIAGDNDFKDCMKLVMEHKQNLILIGYKESAHVLSDKKYCFKFLDILYLLESGMRYGLKLPKPDINKDYLVKIKILGENVQETAFIDFLTSMGIKPKSVEWSIKILHYENESDARNAVKSVFFLGIKCLKVKRRLFCKIIT